jgi:hypothetical protein
MVEPRNSEPIAEVTAMEPDCRERAGEPEDLGRMFLERASAGDVDGVVALYEPTAVLASPGQVRRASRRSARCMRSCWPITRSSVATFVRRSTTETSR